MSRTGWKPRLVLLALLVAVPGAFAAEPSQTQWRLANFTWVKLVPAESGTPANAHPATLSEAALVAALGPVQATVEGREVPLFAKDELKALARPLREALAMANSGEDVILLSTFKRGGGFMEMGVGLTARLFMVDGSLNLIVHDARLAFMDRYSADRTLPAFAYGSRKEASGTRLQATAATRLRGDWLALPLSAAPAVVATPAPAAIAAPVLAPVPVAPAPASAATPRDAAFYEAQGQRLKALKKLREENLLSEAEYQEKRDAILKTL